MQTGVFNEKGCSQIAILLFALLSASVLFFPGAALQLWKGYATVATPSTLPLAELTTRLRESGLEALTPETARAGFTDFSGWVSIPVSGLPARLDSLDPRYDPYLRGLPAYFHTAGWNISYVHTGWPQLVGLARVAFALRGLDWRSGDFDAARTGLCLVAEIILVALVLLRYREGPRSVSTTILAGSLPWLLVAVAGSLEAVVAGTIVFLAWSYLAELTLTTLPYLLERGVVDASRLQWGIAVIAVAILAVGSVLAAKPGIGAVTALGLGADLSWLAARTVGAVSESRGREHVLFFPVEILAPGVSEGRSLIRGAIILLVATAIPLASLVVPKTNIDIPTPVVYPGLSRISWRGLEALWSHRSASSLPTLADYVAHRAYQDGVSYGRGYTFPRRNERVYLTSYSRTGTRISAKRVVVLTYSRRWLGSALRSATGVARLLATQGAPAYALRRPLGRFGSYRGAIVVNMIALFVAGGALLFVQRRGSPGLVNAVGNRERPALPPARRPRSRGVDGRLALSALRMLVLRRWGRARLLLRADRKSSRAEPKGVAGCGKGD